MALLTIGEVAKQKGVSKDTVRNYIKEGKIVASRRERYGKLEYAIDESELPKLPKPYKKRGDTGPMAAVQSGREVPEEIPFQQKATLIIFSGTEMQIASFYERHRHLLMV